MMKRFKILTGLLLIANLAIASADASAQMSSALVPRTQNGITYISGGIGVGPRQAMQAVRKDYNLLLTFATQGTGAYLADVRVVLEDPNGKKILVAVSRGPFFFAKLAPGKYTVIADDQGQVQTQSASVSGGKPVDLYFYWPGK